MNKTEKKECLKQTLLYGTVIVFFIGLALIVKMYVFIPEINENPPQSQSEVTTQKVTETDKNLILINSENALPKDYSVEVRQLKNGQSIAKAAYQDLQNMIADAEIAGFKPLICSSYRSNEKQTDLYNKKIELYKSKGYTAKHAETEAAKWVAIPGTSEHESGLAIDIVTYQNQILNAKQGDTAFFKWLADNSYKYGFVLRYPDGKEKITGINYEPWHYRYVGIEAAKEIFDKNICLEEYILISS